MTVAILNDNYYATLPAARKAAAALELATEMLAHRERLGAVVMALLDAIKNTPDNARPLAEVAEELALDCGQDMQLIQCLETMQIRA